MACIVEFCRKDCPLLPDGADVNRASGEAPCETWRSAALGASDVRVPERHEPLRPGLQWGILASMTCDTCEKEDTILIANPIDDYELFELGWMVVVCDLIPTWICVECAGAVASKFTRLKMGPPHS